MTVMAFCIPIASASIIKSSNSESQMVYICTGPQSRVYHKYDDCKGLSKCSEEIKKITLDKAKSMKRRACKLCY